MVLPLLSSIHEIPPPPTDRSTWQWKTKPISFKDKMPSGSPWTKISIVTPSFNQVQFLEETSRSILLQGYPNLERISMAGGSTDGNIDIIKNTGHISLTIEREIHEAELRHHATLIKD